MKILVATDGSPPARRAVQVAIDLVGRLNTESNHITLINVQELADLVHAQAVEKQHKAVDFLRRFSDRDLKAGRKLLDAARVSHDTVVRGGPVSSEIIKYAQSGKFDLIVVGSKGRTAIADLLVGSVAQRVLAKSRQPVLLVK